MHSQICLLTCVHGHLRTRTHAHMHVHMRTCTRHARAPAHMHTCIHAHKPSRRGACVRTLAALDTASSSRSSEGGRKGGKTARKRACFACASHLRAHAHSLFRARTHTPTQGGRRADQFRTIPGHSGPRRLTFSKVRSPASCSVCTASPTRPRFRVEGLDRV